MAWESLRKIFDLVRTLEATGEETCEWRDDCREKHVC
jgi:hypothetical protein